MGIDLMAHLEKYQLKAVDQKTAISVQFLLLLTSFVTSGRPPHFSGSEIVGAGQSEGIHST